MWLRTKKIQTYSNTNQNVHILHKQYSCASGLKYLLFRFGSSRCHLGIDIGSPVLSFVKELKHILPVYILTNIGI